MKRYIITKVIYSKSMMGAIKDESEGEIVQVVLDQDVGPGTDLKTIGFNKNGR